MDDKNTNLENNGNDAKENKSKIVPSYQKKNEPVDKKEKKKLDKKAIKSRITIISLIIVVILIGLAIFGIVSFINYNKYKPYRVYEQAMKDYGFDIVYDNKSAETGDSVTKSEAIKMVLSCVLNTQYIDGYVTNSDKEYDNALWVEYAIDKNIITSDEITKDNESEKASYIDVIRYFANAKSKILEKELDSKEDIKVKDLDTYKPDEQIAIEDMVANEIIKLNTKKIKGNSKVFKGQINEIINNFVIKYNTITVGDEKVNINEEKIPSNKDQYPYTLASVDKSVYEIEDYNKDNDSYKNAKDSYSKLKYIYPQIQEYVTRYFDVILNIDYNTINSDNFYDSLYGLLMYGRDREEIDAYIKHVKDNQISIKANSIKVNLPAVYYDGRTYRCRTTIEYEITSSNTNVGIFFGDLGAEYDKNNKKLILDVPMGKAIDNNSLTIFNGSINNWIAGNVQFEA